MRVSYIVAAQNSEHLAAAVELHEEALLEILRTTSAEVQRYIIRSALDQKDLASHGKGRNSLS